MPAYTNGTQGSGTAQPIAQMMPTSYIPPSGLGNQSSIPSINAGVPSSLLSGVMGGANGTMAFNGSQANAQNSGGTVSYYGAAIGSPFPINGVMKVAVKGDGDSIKYVNASDYQNSLGNGTGWLSPEELTARHDALQIGGSTSGSGGGAGGGGAGGAAGDGGAATNGGGLNLAGTGPAPVGSTPGQLQGGITQTGPILGYQDPGGINNTGVAGYNNPAAVGNGTSANIQMQQANPQAALNQYQNTAGYQLLNSPGAYQQSPGYQYAMDQAMSQVQNGASARGMLESGAVLKSMQQTASGLAQQDYGNWWNRQNQLYSDYQNRLQGLAGGPTGSADAMTAGANSAQANLQTGSNLGSLFGNQGTSGMGGIINTAAAQSNNMINAGQQQATVNAANQSTQLAGATLASGQRGSF